MEETILSRLKDEHQHIKKLMLRVQRSLNSSERQELFEEFKGMLIPHMDGEEQTLYSILRTDVFDEGSAELANKADADHQEVRDLLEMLESEDSSSKQWRELFEDLMDMLYQHFDTEEGEMFNEAKEDFSREELVRIGIEFEAARSHSSFL